MLLSNEGVFADNTGKVGWGPKSDKDYLYTQIVGKRVMVGGCTWRTIQNFEYLVSLPQQWIIVSTTLDRPAGKKAVVCKTIEEADMLRPDVNFGGIKLWLLRPPETMHVSICDAAITGPTIPKEVLAPYKLFDYRDHGDFIRVVYFRKDIYAN